MAPRAKVAVGFVLRVTLEQLSAPIAAAGVTVALLLPMHSTFIGAGQVMLGLVSSMSSMLAVQAVEVLPDLSFAVQLSVAVQPSGLPDGADEGELMVSAGQVTLGAESQLSLAEVAGMAVAVQMLFGVVEVRTTEPSGQVIDGAVSSMSLRRLALQLAVFAEPVPG